MPVHVSLPLFGSPSLNTKRALNCLFRSAAACARGGGFSPISVVSRNLGCQEAEFQGKKLRKGFGSRWQRRCCYSVSVCSRGWLGNRRNWERRALVPGRRWSPIHRSRRSRLCGADSSALPFSERGEGFLFAQSFGYVRLYVNSSYGFFINSLPAQSITRAVYTRCERCWSGEGSFWLLCTRVCVSLTTGSLEVYGEGWMCKAGFSVLLLRLGTRPQNFVLCLKLQRVGTDSLPVTHLN